MRAVTRWIGDRFAMIAALLVLFYLFLPVLYTFVFSFNDYRKSNITWNSNAGPTLKHWKNPCGAPGCCDSLATSFDRVARTTPERAATVILNGVAKGKARVLIGADARVIDVVSRVAGPHYQRLVARFAGKAGL